MFRYAMGYAAAARHGGGVRLDLGFYNGFAPLETPRTYELGRFRISGRPLNAFEKLLPGVGTTSLSMGLPQRAARLVLRTLPIARPVEILDSRKGFDPRALEIPRQCVLNGDWQSEKYFKDCREGLLREFEFRDETPPGNRAVLQQIGGSTSVCVHVRRGDYTLSHQALKPAPAEYYTNAVGLMRERFPDARFFVFSDDLQWVRQTLPLPPGTKYVDENAGKADAEDLRLMAACRHFIIANSTFSWWAAWLGRSVDKLVVAPKQWYTSPHPSEADLVPQGWTRL